MVMPIVADAESVEVDGIYYNLISKGKIAEVTKNPNGYNITGNLVIPASITYNGEQYSVTRIVDSDVGGYWNGVFANCSGITNVILPKSLTRIGKYAFAGCSGLTNFVIPDGVKEIGIAAFMCSNITSLSIPSSVTKIESEAFRDCYRLSSIYITDLVAWCKISFMGDNYTAPFCGTIASNYTAYHLYLNGEEIKDLVIPDDVSIIGTHTFYGCVGLSSVTISNNVTAIERCAFFGCSGITKIAIPNSVLSIGSEAFRFCNSLTSVHISDIEAWCQISFSGNLSEDWLISNPLSYAHHLYQNGKEINDLVIPNSIMNIRNLAFYGCSGLTTITIPSNVTTIGSGAFYGCSNLSSVTIPNNVTTIGESAFSGCCSLTTISIGNGVKIIEGYAFAQCTELSDVYCSAENITSSDPDNWDFSRAFDGSITKGSTTLFTNESAFDGSYIEYATLHVPESSINAFKTTAPWSGFGTFVTLSGEEMETQKCDTPTINIEDGKIKFSCATEGVEFVSEITAPTMTKKYDKEITLSSTYTVTVYATKSGYDDSDKATIEIQANSGIKGDVDGNGVVNVADHVELTKIIMAQ